MIYLVLVKRNLRDNVYQRILGQWHSHDCSCSQLLNSAMLCNVLQGSTLFCIALQGFASFCEPLHRFAPLRNKVKAAKPVALFPRGDTTRNNCFSSTHRAFRGLVESCKARATMKRRSEGRGQVAGAKIAETGKRVMFPNTLFAADYRLSGSLGKHSEEPWWGSELRFERPRTRLLEFVSTLRSANFEPKLKVLNVPCMLMMVFEGVMLWGEDSLCVEFVWIGAMVFMR